MTTGNPKKYKLYHRLAEAGSADVRRLVRELGLLDDVEFANIEIGERDIGELKRATGGELTPALRLEGKEWIQGRDGIFAFFRTQSNFKG